jgi:thiamine-monophosphate kinase
VLPDGWRAIGSVRAARDDEAPAILVDGRVVTHTGWDHFRAT